MPTGIGFTWAFAWNELVGGFNAFIGLVNVPVAFALALLLVGAVAVMGGVGGGKGSQNKDKKGRAGGHEAWYQFFFGGVANLIFFYWLTSANSSNPLVSSGKGVGVDLSKPTILKVKFESDQRNNVFARIGKEKAIPDKRYWKNPPHSMPKHKEWWKVEVVGKTRDGSKFLLKPVERGKRVLGRFF